MKKLFENVGVIALLMFVVALLDYIVIPLGDFELGVGFILCWLYVGAWIFLKRKGLI